MATNNHQGSAHIEESHPYGQCKADIGCRDCWFAAAVDGEDVGVMYAKLAKHVSPALHSFRNLMNLLGGANKTVLVFDDAKLGKVFFLTVHDETHETGVAYTNIPTKGGHGQVSYRREISKVQRMTSKMIRDIRKIEDARLAASSAAPTSSKREVSSKGECKVCRQPTRRAKDILCGEHSQADLDAITLVWAALSKAHKEWVHAIESRAVLTRLAPERVKVAKGVDVYLQGPFARLAKTLASERQHESIWLIVTRRLKLANLWVTSEDTQLCIVKGKPSQVSSVFGSSLSNPHAALEPSKKLIAARWATVLNTYVPAAPAFLLPTAFDNLIE